MIIIMIYDDHDNHDKHDDHDSHNDHEKHDIYDDHGYPAYSHQSDSHQVGIWHHDEGWECDKFPPYTYINMTRKFEYIFAFKILKFYLFHESMLH